MDAVPWNPDDHCGTRPVGRRQLLAERPGLDAARPSKVDHHVASPLQCGRLSVCSEGLEAVSQNCAAFDAPWVGRQDANAWAVAVLDGGCGIGGRAAGGRLSYTPPDKR